nr:unnamed protein product [Spirometra erinaceieuropaei]
MGHRDVFCKSMPASESKPPPTTPSSRHRFRSKRKPKSQSVGNSLSLLTNFQLNAAGRRKFVDVFLNDHAVRLQLYTASDITIISERLWQSLGSLKTQQTSQPAASACGGLVKPNRQLQCCVTFRGTRITAICYITKSDLNLLGLDWIEKLCLAGMPLRVVCSQVQISAVLADQTKDILQRSRSPRVARIVDHQYPPRSVPIYLAGLWCKNRSGPIPTNDERNALRHPWHTWVPGRHHQRGSLSCELQDRVCAVLELTHEYGFRLRVDKCQFFLDSIKYLGFVFDVTGHHPDPENIRTIQRMPAPKNVSQLRSFLGMVCYYNAFLPSLHDVRAPLNRLLQKDAPRCWSPDCEKAFVQLNSMLSSDLLLTHYDPTLPIVVAADASNHGVGAVTSHTFPDGSEKAIMHASRTLTPAEKNYEQIEKEALAPVFVVKKFHKLLYGRHFMLLTDHEPMLSIFGSKKRIPVYSANRLQRCATIPLGCDLDIRYCHTTEFGQADALLRLISNQQELEEDTVIAAISIEDDVRRQLSDAIRGIPVTAADIRHATEQDSVLRQAITSVQICWPTTALAGDLRQHFLRRVSLFVVDSYLMFADRVVIPSSPRPTVLR